MSDDRFKPEPKRPFNYDTRTNPKVVKEHQCLYCTAHMEQEKIRDGNYRRKALYRWNCPVCGFSELEHS